MQNGMRAGQARTSLFPLLLACRYRSWAERLGLALMPTSVPVLTTWKASAVPPPSAAAATVAEVPSPARGWGYPYW